MQYTSDILAFLWAVINNWAGYATGGVIVAVVWLWSTWKSQAVSRNVGIALAVFFLCVAVFNAWREQRQKVRELEARFKSPNFVGRVVAAAFGTVLPSTNAGVTLDCLIRNPTGPPSAAENWKVLLLFPNGKTVEGVFPPPPSKDIILPLEGKPETFTLQASRHLPLVMRSVVPAGGIAQGWIQLIFFGLTRDELVNSGGKLIISFTDAIEGRSHAFEYQVVNDGRGPFLPSDLK